MSADPSDPLGRLTQHAAEPYAAPSVSKKEMVDYWRGVYAGEAGGITDADLATEHKRAVDAVAGCEAGITEVAERYHTARRVDVGTWEQEEEWREMHAMMTNLEHRLFRLTGRRDALAAEAKRRRGE